MLVCDGWNSGGGGGGDYDFGVGKARFNRADEMSANIHLPDAHRVQPERLPIGERLLQFGIIFPEAFAKARPPVAASQHAPEVIGGREGKKYQKQDVVKDAHGSLPNGFILFGKSRSG